MLRKAFILGAGLGLRLRPLTLNQPKPTLPVLGRPLMEYVFEHLKSAGINEVMINTHHYPEVYTQLFGNNYADLIIHYSYEEKLLDTGGGLKKVESFLKDGTFLVYNGDILTDGDLKEAIRFHRERNCLATLILSPSHHNPNIALDDEGWIQDLRGSLGIKTSRVYTFCGIQILEPEIFQYIPDQEPISIVDVYLNILRKGKKIAGFVWDRCYWKDIGDLTSYEEVHRELFETKLKGPFPVHRLGQDGSDRAYYRIVPSLVSDKNLRRSSVIVMQYGKEKEENNFYHRISLFLRDLGLSVPEILHADPESGILVIEDLGDFMLCRAFEIKPRREIIALYKKVIDEILILHQKGAELYEKDRFSISLPFTEKTYRWESNYFEENFLKGILNRTLSKDDRESFDHDCEHLAKILAKEKRVLIHRDFQSKNIMIKNDRPYFIDFQGMRFGLPQYDVASLLFDPYVFFSDEEREVLFEYYYESLGAWAGDREHFRTIYQFLTIQRLMQALGAYGFLGIRKGKKHFLQYVEPALLRLHEVIKNVKELSGLKAVVNDALAVYKERFKATQSRI